MARQKGSKVKKSEPEISKEVPGFTVKNTNPKSDSKCGCNHGESMHYGTMDRWCNESGCKCQAFQND